MNRPRRLRKGLLFKFVAALSVPLVAALLYLDAWVQKGLTERQWQAPAQVYARPLSLQMGLEQEQLFWTLKQLGYQRAASAKQAGFYSRAADRVVVFRRGWSDFEGSHAAQKIDLRFRNQRLLSVRTLQGDSLTSAQLEPLPIGAVYPQRQEDRMLLRLHEVPPSLLEMIIAVEDRNFDSHWGISLRGIARAAWANFQAGRAVQGGSTLTQQLIKNVFLSRERSLWRKGLEAAMALLAELHFSKEELLELYINEVYLGQEGSRQIHGFALAAQHYFNRPLRELTIGQQAMLVGMIRGPSYYNPLRSPERTLTRRNRVLEKLTEQFGDRSGLYSRAETEPLGVVRQSSLEGVYPAYLDLVRRQLGRDYAAADLQNAGLGIYTSFDPWVQRRAEQSMQRVMTQLSDKNSELQVGVVVADVRNGDVVALLGGRSPRFAGFNRALDAFRPIGSLIKPAVFLAALEQGDRYTLATPIDDSAIQVAGANGDIWQPRNFDRKSHGEVLLHKVLTKSYNQATARLGMEVGLDQITDVLQRLGVQRPLPQVPAMLLGAVELSPLEVAGMYQTIASGGRRWNLRSIHGVRDSDAKALVRYPQRPEQTFDPAVMHLMQYALQEVVQEGTGRGVYYTIDPKFHLAGKTGTTNDLRDSWFAGFSGDYLAVVWVGRDDNAPAGLTGSAGALKVWREIMQQVSRQPLEFVADEAVTYRWVDGSSGLASGELCENSRLLPFVPGTEPSGHANCRRTVKKAWGWLQRIFK